MARRKYDWKDLKNTYLLSDIDEVAEFLRVVYSLESVSNGNARVATQGWREEKEQLRAKIREQVMHEQIDKLKEREKQNLEISSAMENLALLSAHARLKNNLILDPNGKPVGAKITAHEIAKIFEMSRLEQGKTTNNTENTNKNTDTLTYIDSVTNGPPSPSDADSEDSRDGIGILTTPKPAPDEGSNA